MNFTRRNLIRGGVAGALATPLSASSSESQSKKPRGIIFMVSDGMSGGVLPMAQSFSEQVRKKGTHWWQLLADQTAAHGLMDTASSSSMVTDSAAASSAWSSGTRIPNGKINVTENGRELEPIGVTIGRAGVRLGLVTTSSVTHATPAGFAAVSASRGNEDLIATQYLNRAEVVLGGGTNFFAKATRRDRRDLFGDFRKAGYDVVNHRDEMLASKKPRLLGTFAPGHVPYSIDRNASKDLQSKVPTLAEMTAAALDRFLASDKPFLLQVEGARVDHAAHKNDIAALLYDQLAFDDAVGTVLAACAKVPDLLVVVTSDHGNANPGINGTGGGYRQTNDHFARIARAKVSHEQLLSDWKARPGSGNTAAMVAFIEAGLGFKPTPEEAEALLDSFAGKAFPEWSKHHSNTPGLLGQITGNHTGTGWTGVTHTSDPTVVTATGPGSKQFHGLMRNDSVRDKLLEVLKI